MRTARTICVAILIGLLLSTAAMAEERPQIAPAQTGFDLTIEFTQKDRRFLSENIDQPLDNVRKDIHVPILLHNVDGLPAGHRLLQPGLPAQTENRTFEASGDKPFRCWLVRPAQDQQEVSLFLMHGMIGHDQRHTYSAPGPGQIEMEGVQILSHSIVHPGAKVNIQADFVGPSVSSALSLLGKQYDGPVEIIGQSMEKISIQAE
ncbi:MAG: hypothetical protein ACLFWB_01745 [Armatimonadota bacterium]